MVEAQRRLDVPEVSKKLFRGCAQLGTWPLFRPLTWRLSMPAISPELSPGFAWLDIKWLVFWRNRRVRRLAVQAYCLWLVPFLLFCVGQLAMMASILAGELENTRWAFLKSAIEDTRWIFLEYAIVAAMFLAIVALGLSAAAAATSSVTSAVTMFLACASGLRHPAMGIMVISIVLAVPAFLATRFERRHEQYSLVRRLGRIAAAPFVAIGLWLFSGILVTLVLAVIVAAGASARLALIGADLSVIVSEGLGSAEIPLLTMFYSLMPENGAGFAGFLGLCIGVLFSVALVLIGRVTRKW